MKIATRPDQRHGLRDFLAVGAAATGVTLARLPYASAGANAIGANEAENDSLHGALDAARKSSKVCVCT